MDEFDALADPIRRRMLNRLASGPTRVVDLAGELPISRPAVSKHLRVLRTAGLVTAEPCGRETHYLLNSAAFAPLYEYLAGLLPQPPISERTLDALDLEVRRTIRERNTPTTAATKKETA